MRLTTLQASLKLATAATTTRAFKSWQLFSSVIDILDARRHGEPVKTLSTHMKTAFNLL